MHQGLKFQIQEKSCICPFLIMNISFSLSYIQHRQGLVGCLGFFILPLTYILWYILHRAQWVEILSEGACNPLLNS